MLEMGKYGNEAPGAASGNCSDATASRQNLRAASVAAGKSWICHRDIVNLETRRRLARRHSRSAAWRQCHDSIQAAPPAFARQVDSWLPLAVSPREHSPGHRKAASDPTGQPPARAYSYNLQAIS